MHPVLAALRRHGIGSVFLLLCLLLLQRPVGAVGFAHNYGGQAGTGFTQINAMAVDPATGNRYIGGTFTDSILTLGGTSLTRIGTQDAFVAKLNSSGTVLWAKNFGGGGASAYGQALAMDGSGNPYIGGYFKGANLTTPALNNIGTQDAFVIKLDAATGGTTWAKNFGGSGATAYGNALAVDGSGNPYIGGYFKGANLTTPALNNIGTQDAFVIKLDATTGGTTWAKNFGGSGAGAYGYALAVDGSGNPYLGGYFDSANLTTPALTKIGAPDAFVIKLDATTGGTTWAKNFGGSAANVYGRVLAVDGSGNPYLGGHFVGYLTTLALTSIGIIEDAFIIKLDATTGGTTWAKNFGGSGAGAYGYALAVDGSGNPYLGGKFVLGNLATPALTKIGDTDAFVIKLDATTGGTTWAKNFGGSRANVYGGPLAVGGSGNLYLGGYFTAANLTTPALTKIGGQDAFVIKLDATTGGTTSTEHYFGLSPSGNTKISGAAVDASGNEYIVGYFNDVTLTLGATTLTRIGYQDAFLAKLDGSGAVLWAKNFGGIGATAYGNALAVDGSGNPYLGGYFTAANLTMPALTKIGQDAFVIKLDATTGGTTWAKNFGGSAATVYGYALAVDGSGNPYLGGYFTAANLTMPALTKIGGQDAFVIKLDATTGGTTWAKNFGGIGANVYGRALAVDGSGNPFLGGYFFGNLTTPALTTIGADDAFVIKLDATTGGTTWAKNFGGEAAAYGIALAMDGSGNPYIGGYFLGNLTTPALTKIGNWDAFVIKLNATTGGTTWAKNFGGSGANAYGIALAVDGSGKPYLGGYFTAANLTTPTLTKIGGQDAFVIKLDATTGGATWAKNFGGSGAYAYGGAVAVDGSGNPYLGGGFQNANLTTPPLTRIGGTDAFFLSLVQVNYNGNGNTGGAAPIDNHAYLTGDNVTVLSNSGALIKTGYTFAGWNTTANGSGMNYAATGNASFTMGSAPITLYAQWTVPGAPPNYSDSWWNANESGWGITITDHDSNAFVQWYTYDQSGHNQKYVIPGGAFANNKCQFSGTIQHVTGPSWTATTFDPNLVVRTNAGTGSFDLCPSGLATGTIVFNYTVDGVTGSKQLTRLPFGNDVPHWNGTANTGAADFTDLWVTPAESGWGMSLTQHGNNIFFRIFVYDTDGRPLLFVVPGVTMTNATSFTGALQLTTGPWFGSDPFDPNMVTRATAGSATLSFSDANNATLSYTVNGVTKTKAIARLAF